MSERTSEPSGVLHAGGGEPLVLFHGVTCSAQVWQPVLPSLTSRHEVWAPTALGHRGGTTPRVRPVRIADVIDDAERFLDALALDTAHLAGNSLGGWVALELARRGRARSVCALSPAGAWRDGHRAGRKLAAIAALTRATRPLLPFLASSAHFRRLAMRDNAAHGERVGSAELLRLADDMLGCAVIADLLATTEALEPMRLSCPVTLAWSQNDRIFPVDEYAPTARARVPDARFIVLPDVGHVPMLDDAQLVAKTILATTQPKSVERAPMLRL